MHIRELESQHEQLLQQLIHKQEEVSSLQGALRKSRARTGALEAQMEDLERHREDAVSTLFRLRPQRQECPETEIRQDYDSLKASIESWIEKNCEAFLDNERLGLDIIGEEDPNGSGSLSGHEIILNNFRSRPDLINNAKDQVLIAVIMRYVCDKILNQNYPVWLHKDQKVLFYDIENSMKELEPRKGKS